MYYIKIFYAAGNASNGHDSTNFDAFVRQI